MDSGNRLQTIHRKIWLSNSRQLIGALNIEKLINLKLDFMSYKRNILFSPIFLLAQTMYEHHIIFMLCAMKSDKFFRL